MKIVSKIDEKHYVIEIEPNYVRQPTRVVIAHDYVRFYSGSSIPSDVHVGSCANYCPFNGELTIGIRDFVDIIKPMLDKHEYCQPEHLIHDSGEAAYCYTNGCVKYTDTEGKTMYAVRVAGEPDWCHLTQRQYDRFILRKDD